MISLNLNPQDVLFFRDGKPFGADASFAETIFPPFPSTFAGALRAILLHHFTGDRQTFDQQVFYQSKNELLKKIVGEFAAEKDSSRTVFKQSAALKVRQIVLEKENIRYYSAPVDLPFSWVEESTLPFYYRGKKADHRYRLLNLDAELKKPPKNDYLDEEQLKSYLLGQDIDKPELQKEAFFFLDEPHIKNRLESSLKVSRDEGGLYMYNMKRIKKGVSFRVLFEAVEEVQKMVEAGKKEFIPLGGENRVAYYQFERKENNAPYGSIPWKEFDGNYEPDRDLLKLLFTTPAVAHHKVPGTIKEHFHIRGKAVSGTAPVGGWDLKNRLPKPMYRAYLPGTVILVEPCSMLDEKTYYQILNTQFSDERPEEGFGSVLLGIQKDIINQKERKYV